MHRHERLATASLAGNRPEVGEENAMDGAIPYDPLVQGTAYPGG